MPVLLTLLLLAAPDVGVEVKVKKPLKLDKRGDLAGRLEVQLVNRGAQAVTLQHRDVHGFRFQPVSGDAGMQVIFHTCDCAFELAMQAPPESRTFTLKPGEKKTLVFDDFSCGGGPFKPPPPGKYQVTFSIGEPAPPPAKGAEDAKLDLKECDLRVHGRAAEAFESSAVPVDLRR